MNLTPESPELTALVLGELPETERREVEAIVSSRPDLQAEVEHLRTLTKTIGLVLGSEPAWELSAERRRRILESRKTPKKQRLGYRIRSWSAPEPSWFPWTGWAIGLSSAAAVALVCLFYWNGPTRPLGEMSLSNPGPEPRGNVDGQVKTVARRFQLEPGREGQTAGVGGPPNQTMGGARFSEVAAKADISNAVELLGAISNTPSVLAASAGAPMPALAMIAKPPPSETTSLAYQAPEQLLSGLNYQDSSFAPAAVLESFDDSSYRLIRSRILEGLRPLPEFVRLEEMINYFRYDVLESDSPGGTNAYPARLELTTCPWNAHHALLRMAIQVGDPSKEGPKNKRLMLAIDGTTNRTSGFSLEWLGGTTSQWLTANRGKSLEREVLQASRPMTRGMAAAKRPAARLLEEVAQSSNSPKPDTGLALDGNANRFISTNGLGVETAISRAYVSTESLEGTAGGRPTVMLVTQESLASLPETNRVPKIIQDGAKAGVQLDIIALGLNPEDTPRLAQWASYGNGIMATADTKADAVRAAEILAQGRREPVAEKVIAEVSWNTNQFGRWRALGRLVSSDSTNEPSASLNPAAPALRSEAAEFNPIRQGNQYVALFELSPPPFAFGDVGGFGGVVGASGDVVRLHVLATSTNRSEAMVMTTVEVADRPKPFSEASADFKFSAAVAGFGLLLRDTEEHDGLTWDMVLEMARSGIESDVDGTRAELVDLVTRAKSIASKPSENPGK